MKFKPEYPTHAADQERIGVLLVNLGTPSAPKPEAVRAYLREFLSDTRVVELPKWVWQPLLRGIVLPLRSKKSAHAYEKIWFKEGSPLLVFTRRQAEGLRRLLPDYRTAPVPFYAVYTQRKLLSAKVRSFIDFMVEKTASEQAGL